jgi:hypothetical protein
MRWSPKASLTGEAPPLTTLCGGIGSLHSAGPAPESRARGGARQARKLQSPGLQLQPGRRRTATALNPQATSRCSSAPAARRAAGFDRGRGHDSGQQHLGRWLGEWACRAFTAARPASRRASRCAWAPSPAPCGHGRGAIQPGPPRRCAAMSTWSTSGKSLPCAKHGRTAALVAPFKPKDTDLFAIISGFDAAYSAYNGFQSGIERYWTPALAAAERALT